MRFYKLLLAVAIVTLVLVVARYRASVIYRGVMSPSLSIKAVAKQIVVYAEREGRMPDPNRWCDLLVENVSGDIACIFGCPQSDAIVGESSYAMNKNLAGMRIEDIPNDVVVLFESDLGKNTFKCPRRARASFKEREDDKGYGDVKVWKYRWNQSGGPEIVTTARRKRNGHWGCYVVYLNCGRERVSARWVRREDVDTLKWQPKGEQ